MNTRSWSFIVALTLSSLTVAACDSSESETTSTNTTSSSSTTTGAGGAGGGGGATTSTSVTDSGGAGGGLADGYLVEYVASSPALHVGKGSFQIKLMTGGHQPATGLASSIGLAPMMDMGMMAHGSPVPIDAVTESATPGVYDCTLYFPMASVDASGNPAGQWTVDVAVGLIPAGKLDLTVGRAEGTSTTHVMLKNSADTIMGKNGQTMRSYPLFADSLAPADGGDFRFQVFVATIQEGAMVWPPVTVGLELVDSEGTVQRTIESLDLQASTDGATWFPMDCDASSRCGANLGGLSAGVAGKVFVKMAVNGADYTTDGEAPGASNGYASFTVTP